MVLGFYFYCAEEKQKEVFRSTLEIRVLTEVKGVCKPQSPSFEMCPRSLGGRVAKMIFYSIFYMEIIESLQE